MVVVEGVLVVTTEIVLALAAEERERAAARDRVLALWETPLLSGGDRASLARCAAALTNGVTVFHRGFSRMGPWGRADGFWDDARAAWGGRRAR